MVSLLAYMHRHMLGVARGVQKSMSDVLELESWSYSQSWVWFSVYSILSSPLTSLPFRLPLPSAPSLSSLPLLAGKLCACEYGNMGDNQRSWSQGTTSSVHCWLSPYLRQGLLLTLGPRGRQLLGLCLQSSPRSTRMRDEYHHT